MKNIVYLLSIFLFITISVLNAQSCDITIGPDVFYIDGESMNIPAGSTVCIEGSEKDYLLLRNIHGTENNPIIIKNVGSEVIFNTDHYFGIKIANCSFIKFLGNG